MTKDTQWLQNYFKNNPKLINDLLDEVPVDDNEKIYPVDPFIEITYQNERVVICRVVLATVAEKTLTDGDTRSRNVYISAVIRIELNAEIEENTFDYAFSENNYTYSSSIGDHYE